MASKARLEHLQPRVPSILPLPLRLLPLPCPARVVGGTKPPEIARVVLWPGGGAILYHWVLSFMGENRVRIVLAAR